MTKTFTILSILYLCLFIAACGKDDGVHLTPFDTQIQSYLASESIQATRSASGLYHWAVSIDSANLSSISNGEVVYVYYRVIDIISGDTISAYQRTEGDSLAFKVGANAVYPVGLNEAVLQMTPGDEYAFVLPPAIGYESTGGAASIPDGTIIQVDLRVAYVADETQIFAAEVDSIQRYILANELNNTTLHPVDSVIYDESTQLFYKRTAIGAGNLPTTEVAVSIDYAATYFYTGQTFQSETNFSHTFGAIESRALIDGLTLGIANMQVGESALLILPSSIAYRESALIVPATIASDLASVGIVPDYATQVPAYCPLIFAVTRNE